MEKNQTAKIGRFEYWPVQSRRFVLEQIPGLDSTLGALFRDNGRAEHYPDHCRHIGGLFPTTAGVFCLFCDSYPALHNPQFFTAKEE